MLDLTGKTELFIDGYLISEKDSVFLRQNYPERKEIVLKLETPWEARGSFLGSVVDLGSEVRLYYRGYPYEDGKGDYDDKQVTCLAVSEDGINFARPKLGLIDFQQYQNTNIVNMGTLSHNFCVMYDKNPKCSPEEKYKAICGLHKTGLCLFTSPDGIHFKPYKSNPLPVKGVFDTLNVLFYDCVNDFYRIYFRYWDNPEAPSFTSFKGMRAIASVTTRDFVHFTEITANVYNTDVREELYTNATTPCPGAEHIFLSFPMRFAPQRKKIISHESEGVSDSQVMTSRDGVNWDRGLENPWITPGLENELWTQRNFITMPGIVERNGEFYFYDCEHYWHPSAHIRRYSIPKHRFASVSAQRKEGSFTTKPLYTKSSCLKLNYRTSAYGSVDIDIIRETGGTVNICKNLYGNELAKEISIPDNAGRFMLRFKLREADLYAITF